MNANHGNMLTEIYINILQNKRVPNPMKARKAFKGCTRYQTSTTVLFCKFIRKDSTTGKVYVQKFWINTGKYSSAQVHATLDSEHMNTQFVTRQMGV